MWLLFGFALLCTMVAAGTPPDQPMSYFNIYYNVRGQSLYPNVYSGSMYGYPPMDYSLYSGVNGAFYPYSNLYSHQHYPVLPSYPREYSVKEIFQNPILVAVKSEKGIGYNVYFAEKGLYSIFQEEYLKPVRSYFQTPVEKSAVVFYPNSYFNSRYFVNDVNQLVLPEHFKFGDFAKWINYFHQVPIFAVFEKDMYETYHFDNVVSYGKYAVYPEYIGSVVEEPIRSTKH